MRAILVSGTPGTGKSTVARLLASRLGVECISLGDLVVSSGCISSHDAERDTDVIDEDCVVDAILDLAESRPVDHPLVIEGHYVDLVPREHVKKVFVLRVYPETLRARLRARGYSENKVAENVQAEVIGMCQMDAIDAFGESLVVEVDATDLTPDEVLQRILELSDCDGVSTRIDWMEELEAQGVLDRYFDM